MQYPWKKSAKLLMVGVVVAMYGTVVSAADSSAAKKKDAPGSGKPVQAKLEKAATVNGIDIPMKELEQEYNQAVKQIEASGKSIDSAKTAEVKKSLLEGMINQELLFQESKKQKIAVTDENVSASLKQVKGNFPDDAAFKAALKDANLSEAELSTRIRRGLTINGFIDAQITQKTEVSDAEVKAYYDAHPDAFKQAEQVHASHILVKVAENASESDRKAAMAKIEKIQARLKAGEDFAALAKETSDCPSAAEGGDLGFFERGKMVPEFETAAFSLKPGETSPVVKTMFGYHLIKVSERKEASQVALDTVKKDLQAYLKKQKIMAGVTQMVETLKAGAKIERYL